MKYCEECKWNEFKQSETAYCPGCKQNWGPKIRFESKSINTNTCYNCQSEQYEIKENLIAGIGQSLIFFCISRYTILFF